MNRQFRKKVFLSFFSVILSIFIGVQSQAKVLVRPLRDPISAMRARIELIRSAKKELIISALDFDEDVIGDGFLSEIRDARARGVEVYWIIDNAVPSFLPGGGPIGVSKELASYLKSIGVNFKTYNQFDWRHPIKSLTMRLHDKCMIADRTRRIGGDRNIGAYYFNTGGETAAERQKEQFDDLDLYTINQNEKGKPVPGGAAEKAALYLLEVFNLKDHSKPVSTKGYAPAEKTQVIARIDHAKKMIARVFDSRNSAGFSRLNWPADAPSFTIEDDAIEFIHDVPGRKGQEPGTAEKVMELFDRAEKSIFIVTPYLILTKEMEAHLRAARARGVEITLMTSSKRSTDMKQLTAIMDSQNRLASDLGIKILEYVGRDSLHIKSFVIDGKYSFLGSFNLNGRSEFQDTESGDIIDSVPLAQYLRSLYDKLPVQELSRRKLVRRDKNIITFFKRVHDEKGFVRQFKNACNLIFSNLFKKQE